MTYDLSGYVEVDERIRVFKSAHPDGFLTGEGEFIRNAAGEIIGYLYWATAHVSADSPVRGVGTAYEPIPGRTPYTKDSEVMNAETSAWGRAIAALGFDFGKIASANEIRNRQETPGGAGQTVGAGTAPAPASQPPSSPTAGSTIGFGKHKDKTLAQIAEADRGYLHWMAEKMEAKTEKAQTLQRMARELLSLPTAQAYGDDSEPF